MLDWSFIILISYIILLCNIQKIVKKKEDKKSSFYLLRNIV